MILGPATTSEWLQVLCAFTSHTIIQGTQFSPPLALYNPTRDLKGSYSLSFLLILHFTNAPTNMCALTKTPVRTSYQSTGLHNEQSSNGGHFDLDAAEVDGFGSIGVEIDQLPRIWTRFQRGSERTAEVQDDQVERG
jgi:hypothetical protein